MLFQMIAGSFHFNTELFRKTSGKVNFNFIASKVHKASLVHCTDTFLMYAIYKKNSETATGLSFAANLTLRKYLAYWHFLIRGEKKIWYVIYIYIYVQFGERKKTRYTYIERDCGLSVFFLVDLATM